LAIVAKSLSVLWSEFDLSGLHGVIGHVTIPHRPFPIDGPLEPRLCL